MLNTMRKNLKSLSWVLWLTVASFVIAIFAVWGGGGDAGGTSANWMARVNGSAVSVSQFQDAYQNLDRFYRQVYQGNYDARSLGVARQALNQLIRDRLILDEARRLGLRTSPAEISRAITLNPAFQLDGRFMGVDAYKQFLTDRGIDVAEYEQSVAHDLLAAKYRRLVTDSITVSTGEVREDYRSRNEKVQADYFLLEGDKLAAQATVDDAALETYFEAHRGDYLSPERRQGSYVLIGKETLGNIEPVSEDVARAYYEENLERLYTKPAQIRASQILLKVDPGASAEEEAEVRSRAEDLLLRVRAGEDFAELARTYSEDTSQTLGGDLGFFGRGRMRPAFEDAAFALAVGETSDLVRTEVGFHIIRVTDRREASVQPYSEVRDSIVRQLEFSRTQEAVSQAVQSFRNQVDKDPTRFDAAAAELGLTVEDTGIVSADESIAGLGDFPQAVAALFEVEVGGVSAPVVLPQGTVFLQTREVHAPEPLSFADARPRVEADFRRERGVAEAERKIREQADAGADLASVAKSFDATVASTGEFTSLQTVEPFNAEARQQAFAAPLGKIATPVEVDQGLLVYAVTEHQPFDAAAFEEAEGNLRNSILQRRRNLLFNAVVDRLHAESQIQVNQALLDRFEGRGT